VILKSVNRVNFIEKPVTANISELLDYGWREIAQRLEINSLQKGMRSLFGDWQLALFRKIKSRSYRHRRVHQCWKGGAFCGIVQVRWFSVAENDLIVSAILVYSTALILEIKTFSARFFKGISQHFIGCSKGHMEEI